MRYSASEKYEIIRLVEASSLPIRQTQGKIERWRRSMKNQNLLNHYYLPSELQEHLQRFIR